MNPLLVPITRPDLGIYLPKQFPPQMGVAPGLAAVDKLVTTIQPVLDVQGTFKTADRPSIYDAQGAAGVTPLDWTPPLTDPNTFAWIVAISGEHDDGTARYLEIQKILVYPGTATVYLPLAGNTVAWGAGYPLVFNQKPFPLANGNGIRLSANALTAGNRLRLTVEYHIMWAGQYGIPF